MSTESALILLVEDAPDMRLMARAFLEDSGYIVVEMEDAESAWEYLEKNHESVDAVLLDILLPGMDGYDLCKQIKQDGHMGQIPVVFASSLTDLDEKIKGYNCGADDYVTKPISFEELSEKIKRILQVRNAAKKIQKQVSVSNSAALEAMNYSSDLGQIINFYKSSLNSQNYEELAKHIFEVTNFLSLKATVMFVVDNEVQSFSASGTVSPLETNILEMTRGGKRFFDFAQRTIVTHETFSLLIKNMPIDRPERYGVLKDTLGALGDAIEARVYSLIQNSLESTRQNLIQTVQKATKESEDTFSQIYREIETALHRMNDDIEDAFISLGLTEQQEQHIRDTISTGIANTESAMNKGDKLLSSFDLIGSTLEQTLSIKSS